MEKIFREILRIFIQPINAFIKWKKINDFKKLVASFKPDFIIHNAPTDILDKITKDKMGSMKVVHNCFDIYKNWDIKLGNFQNIILLTSQEINRFQEEYPKSNFYVIPNFLPEIPKTHAEYSQKIVLGVGRLEEQKCFSRLIDIWSFVMQEDALKEWKLHIVGDGHLKPQIEAKIEALGLCNSVVLKPFTKEIEKEYLNASIYVMSSLFEGLPMVLLEASSFGLPCVAFDVKTGPRDVIEDKRNGFLIEDNACWEFAEKLKFLMQDRNLREAMGRESKRITKEKFSKEIIMQQWIELFAKIKKEKKNAD
ncbi:glycosyltransferase [Helicobacter turcicus]|uniref:Glycosyltransferase n=1 Tax=Helicobacter turcicus TaxID=2867412 RepID=A0ABS7JM15_9HELI|nr:glycosyltransferase [Helicobacter turcicus]MBX7490432.1 glycosyltransferase [Helicobacter turcicus]MBX7545291.1 glycosyltransferase [Helicobacter turcicus]